MIRVCRWLFSSGASDCIRVFGTPKGSNLQGSSGPPHRRSQTAGETLPHTLWLYPRENSSVSWAFPGSSGRVLPQTKSVSLKKLSMAGASQL